MTKKLSDSQIAKRLGIAKSTFSVKSAGMKEQLRSFVEAGGDKETEAALHRLMSAMYRAALAGYFTGMSMTDKAIIIGSRRFMMNPSEILQAELYVLGLVNAGKVDKGQSK